MQNKKGPGNTGAPFLGVNTRNSLSGVPRYFFFFAAAFFAGAFFAGAFFVAFIIGLFLPNIKICVS